jgi:alpha-glucosidase (family GH31 glycosyl hydrolase)
MMRALQWTQAEASPYQYYLGRDLLVSPIVEEGCTQTTITLPHGTWRDYWTGEQIVGGTTLTVDVPLERIGVWERQ